ncbi:MULTISPECIES: hypothetical protein [unclassified Rhodococcus (in: high G+C Gram-positive bacteria)]|uniref:hypothetical protein n=1 Tax=unclassified Rhodococcus (in: high G+C Gram-positive bacteria) TaxID=192944 RepID=UPI00163997B4|nr:MULTISPECIES: hypothetical protein [unclassified Rhodococcus (in: high G+C Gram-positive bacteria)]MBC2642728.1 hypothetical protein [Rhodococcus sp. 3A]MBC2892530.1 hypothetical protein [Rhodococcus sp. 4CII]
MIRITVTVDADHLDTIEAVGAALRQRGMRVDQVHRTIGIISGAVGEDDRALLESVPGVQSVETENTIRIPPPDANPQ